MGGNSLSRMDGHLLNFLRKNFRVHTKKVTQAYLGVWKYMLYIGQK